MYEIYISVQYMSPYMMYLRVKLSADQVLVFDWIAGSYQLNMLKTGQGCWEPG